LIYLKRIKKYEYAARYKLFLIKIKYGLKAAWIKKEEN